MMQFIWMTTRLQPMYLLMLLVLLFLTSGNPTLVHCMKHNFYTKHGKSLIGPVGVPFGYNAGGHFKLNVFDFELKLKHGSTENADILNKVEPGFYLQRFTNEQEFNQQMELWKSNSSLCSFDYFLSINDYADDEEIPPYDDYDDYLYNDYDGTFGDTGGGTGGGGGGGTINSAIPNGIYLSMMPKTNWKPGKAEIEYSFKTGEEGLYFLIYQVCPYNPDIYSTFELDFHFNNIDSMNHPSYLSSGEMKLPLLFLFFSVSYLILFVIWFTNIREIQKGGHGHFAEPGERPTVYAIHQLMSLLLILKFLSVLFESIRYYELKETGHAELISFVYYSITFVKGFFLFCVILLIGTGWSFVKPFLQDREKKVIIAVLILQCINNLAIVVLTQETEGESSYARWAGLLHIVDILCCCAVLVPIVWQVNELERSIGLDDSEGNGSMDLSEREMALEASDKGHILSKLKLFRTFYLLVVAYIYSTRILVYLFATMLDYRHLWVRYFVVEIVTLTFYVAVGLMFRPVSEIASYQGISKTDENENENGAEMMALTTTNNVNSDKRS